MRVLGLVGSTCCLVLFGCGSGVPVERVAISVPTNAPSQSATSRSPPGAEQPLPATPPPAHSDGPPITDAADRGDAPPITGLPRTCTGEGKQCYPPEGFVHLLCQKRYPGVAVKMFEKAAPWQRGYVKVKDVAAHNAHGGPTASTRLEFLEEVILLRVRPNRYRDMMSNMPTSYDVFRFDGTCATLAEDEFMTKKPVLPSRYAPFTWSQIDPAIRRALVQDPKVEKARQAQTELCHGSMLTGGNLACRDATQQLARAMLSAAANGSPLPLPNELPEWPAVPDARVSAGDATR
jgi:hypothetical protein